MKLKKLKSMNLLGLEIKVKYSSNINLEGISGKVIDETRNMLMVKKADGKIAKIPKDVCVFEVMKNGKKYLIDGVNLVGRIERRLTGK